MATSKGGGNVAKLRSIVDATDPAFGGARAGATAAVNQAAVAAALLTGASIVWMPGGTFDHNAVLAVNSAQSLRGQGENSTILRQNTAGANGIDVLNKTWASVIDLQVKNNSGAATGQGIRVQGGGNNKLVRVRTDSFDEGIRIASTSPCAVQTAYVLSNVSYGVRVMSTGGVACTDVTLKDVLTTANTGTGLFIDGRVDGVYIDTVQTSANGASGLITNSNADGSPAHIISRNLLSDSNGAYGIRLQATNSSQFTDTWASNRGANKNFEVVAGCVDIRISGGKVYNCYGHGIEAAGGRVSIIGTMIENAGANAADTYDGVYVTGSDFVGAGIHVFSGNSGAADKTRYGVNFVAGATDYTLIGGDCRGVFNATKVNDAAAHSGGVIWCVGGFTSHRIRNDLTLANGGGITLGNVTSITPSTSDNSTTISQSGPIKLQVSGSTKITMDSSGRLLVGTSGVNVRLKVYESGAGGGVLSVQGVSGTLYESNDITTTYTPNFANAAMWMAKDSTTNRSLDAAGTLNANGADYAEYEKKRADCGVIAKGQVVGFDENGLLTDRWNMAVTFGVKSTDPSLVGGDTWANPEAFGLERPEMPAPPQVPPYSGAQKPAEITEKSSVDDKVAYSEALAKWMRERADYLASIDTQVQIFEAETIPAFEKELAAFKAAFDAKYEEARPTVDRVAYAGKCPVNVYGAKVGQWIVAAADAKDGITGVASDAWSQDALGRVRRILADGRAEIKVI